MKNLAARTAFNAATLAFAVALFNACPALAANTGSADDTGIPQPWSAEGTPSPASAPTSRSAPAYDPFSPVQACMQMCACPAGPGGAIVIPTPSAAALAKASPSGTPESLQAPAGPEGPNASGSTHGGGYHGHGTYGRHRTPEGSDDTFGYPAPFVDRPLVLPTGLTQPEFAVTFFNDSLNTASSVNERIQFGSQTGVAEGWQAGALVNVTTRPRVAFDSLILSGQYAINPVVSARLDMGVRHGVCGVGLGNAFAGGIGAPFKYRLNPHLALISGRPTVEGFQDDFFTWDMKGCGGTIPGTTMTAGIPVGFQASLGESINFALRSGYRQLFGSGLSTGFIPLAFDFAYVIAGQADVGLTFSLPNALGTPTDLDRTQTQLFEQRLTIFAQTRL